MLWNNLRNDEQGARMFEKGSAVVASFESCAQMTDVGTWTSRDLAASLPV